MSEQKRDFDKDAALWDENPGRSRVADGVAQAINDEGLPEPSMDVLDFGCGTGLLALRLLPHARSVTGADTSPGMLDVFRAKIQAQSLSNASAQLLDPETDDLEGVYDLIVSSMTLHHIPDVAALFRRFYAALKPGGWIALADLEPEDGQFHADPTGVFHFGFPREALLAMAAEAGFETPRHKTALTIEKPAADGQVRPFPIFLLVAQKKSPMVSQ